MLAHSLHLLAKYQLTPADSPAVNHFLAVTCVDLRRLSKHVDSALSGLHKALVDSKPMLDELLFYASELANLTEWTERADALGLAAPSTRSLLSQAEEAVIIADQAIDTAQRSTVEFRNLFVWIQQQTRRCGSRTSNYP